MARSIARTVQNIIDNDLSLQDALQRGYGNYSAIARIIKPNVEKVLLALKPDIHAKGSDYTEETVPEKETVKGYGGAIAITGGPKIKSTSQLIKEIASKIKERE